MLVENDFTKQCGILYYPCVYSGEPRTADGDKKIHRSMVYKDKLQITQSWLTGNWIDAL